MIKSRHHGLLWLNYVKAILAILLVYTAVQRLLFQNGYTGFGHAFHVSDSIIHSFLIPASFLVAGVYFHSLAAVYRHGKFYYFLFDKLVYVFVLWTIIQGILQAGFSNYTGGNALVTDIYYLLTSDPSGHLRLLPALVVNILLARFIVRVDRPTTSILLLFVFVPAYIFQSDMTLFYPFNLIAEYFCFFLLGIIAHRFRFYFLRHTAHVAIAGIPLFIIAQYLFHGVFARESYHPDFYTFCLAVTGILALTSCCMLLGRFKFQPLNYIGQMAFIIFLMHFIVSSGLREILGNSFSISNAYAHLLIGIVAGIGIPLAVAKFVRYGPLNGLVNPPVFIRAHRIYDTFFAKSAIRYASLAVSGIALAFYLFLYIGSSVAIARSGNILKSSSVILSTNEDHIKEGGRLAQILGCFRGCHGNNLEGTVFFRSPLVGTFVAPNLTHSIRKYSVAEIDGIVRQGLWPDGSPVVGGMPSAGFSALSDAQLGMILSFIQSMPVQPNILPQSSLGIKTRMDIVSDNYVTQHELIDRANTFFSAPDSSPRLQRGQALVRAACSECHGHTLQGNPSLGSPSLSVVQAYNFDQFSELLKTGTAPGNRKMGLMGVVARNRFIKLNERELHDIFAYLNALQ